MKYLYVNYPKCSTCQKAKKWLNDNSINYTDRHIVNENPTEQEIKKWHKQSGLPLKKFFNTSGTVYRTLELSKKLGNMSEEEQYAILATDGMLVKRPIIVGQDIILVGFNSAEWEKLI